MFALWPVSVFIRNSHSPNRDRDPQKKFLRCSNCTTTQKITNNFSDYYKQFFRVKDEDRMKKEKFSFETIRNIRPYVTDFCVTCREGMKNWNICVQYWLAVNIYKEIPTKKFRTAITMFVSAVWHGMYAGYYICICAVPFYLVVEDLYVKLFLKENSGKVRTISSMISNGCSGFCKFVFLNLKKMKS